jgi:hypothetical protein
MDVLMTGPFFVGLPVVLVKAYSCWLLVPLSKIVVVRLHLLAAELGNYFDRKNLYGPIQFFSAMYNVPVLYVHPFSRYLRIPFISCENVRMRHRPTVRPAFLQPETTPSFGFEPFHALKIFT